MYHDRIRQYVCLYCEPGLETHVSSECRRLHLNRVGQGVSLYCELGNKGKRCVFYQGAVDCTLTEWNSVSVWIVNQGKRNYQGEGIVGLTLIHAVSYSGTSDDRLP